MGRVRQGDVCYQEIAYAPLPSQRLFHASQARFKGFSGPVGSGKSQALCQEAIKLSYLNPGRVGLIGAPTYPMLRDATQAALFEILEANETPYEFSKSENILRFADTGSRVLFRPLDDYERLRGTNLAWFGLDELTYAPEEAWSRLEARLRDPLAHRLCGFGTWTPKGFDWVYRRFLAEKVEGYEVIIARPQENRHLLEKVPDFYQRLERSYDENFYRQEVLGEYLSLNGSLVYKQFRRAEHAQELAVNEWRPLLWALDFNVDPMCSVVAQAIGETVHVLDEIVLRNASTEEACAEFEARFEQHRGGLVVYGDASGHHRQTASGRSDWETIRSHFRGRPIEFKTPASNPSVRERVQLVNSKLRNASGDIRLLVDPKCKELIKDLEQVSYLPDTVQIDKDRDRRRTHLSDALGYLLWQEFRPAMTVGERGERLF